MDFSFQLFSPLRQAPEKKKKKGKHSVESDEDFVKSNIVGNGHTISPKRKHRKQKAHIVPSSNVDSDSNVDEDIISLAKKVSSSVEGKMSPKKRSKVSDDSASPRKKSRSAKDDYGPLTSTQTHAVSESSDDDDDASMSQSLLTGEKPTFLPPTSTPAIRRRDRVSPDLFSNIETDEEPLPPFTQIVNIPKTNYAVKKEKTTPKKESVKNSPKKAAKMDSDSSSGSESESDVESSVIRTNPTGVRKAGSVPVKGGRQSSSSESESDSDSGQQTQVTKVPLPKKVPPPKDKYECPVGFQEVEFTDTPLTVENLGANKEIWLLRIPADYDVSKLDSKKFVTDAVIQVGKDSDVQFEMHSSRSKKKAHKTSLLLPSKADNKLHYAGQPMGQMWLSESHSIPPVVMPKPKPLRDTQIPAGLKMRNIPFGAGVPVNTRITSVDTTSPRRKHKKKKKRHSENFESTMDTIDNSVETADDNSQMQTERKKAKKKKKETMDSDRIVDTVDCSIEPNETVEDSSESERKKAKKKKKKHKKDKAE